MRAWRSRRVEGPRAWTARRGERLVPPAAAQAGMSTPASSRALAISRPLRGARPAASIASPSARSPSRKAVSVSTVSVQRSTVTRPRGERTKTSDSSVRSASGGRAGMSSRSARSSSGWKIPGQVEAEAVHRGVGVHDHRQMRAGARRRDRQDARSGLGEQLRVLVAGEIGGVRRRAARIGEVGLHQPGDVAGGGAAPEDDGREEVVELGVWTTASGERPV